MMRFYKQQHEFYCGIDLHAKTMHVCLVNQAGAGARASESADVRAYKLTTENTEDTEK